MAQGRTMTIRVPKAEAAGATAIYRGREHRMVASGDEFWTVIGAGATQQLGTYTITVNMLDERGALLREVVQNVEVYYTEWPVEYITLPPGQIEGIPAEDVQREQNIRAATFAQFTPQKLWSGPFILPSAGPLTGNYGDARSYNGGPVGSHHSGTDFAASEGAPAMAAATGRVAFVGYLATRGNSVIIDHGVGVFTGYHHLSRIDVAQGQDIAQGQVVGGIGATGLATGPHLHWELIVGGVNVDPVYWTFAGVAP
jgi:murein DD-endopeptidase MepM/ murein hydrolase activator NlpD